MTLDTRLIQLLVCPVCKGPLQMMRDADERPAHLSCAADRLAFPIRDGIPVMLESEAASLDADGHVVSSPSAPPTPAAPAE